MGRMAYYSPGIVAGLIGLVYAAFGTGLPTAAERVGLAAWLVPVLVLVGLLLMLAAQGTFAGVLPVPLGKSLRGTKCQAIGLLIIAGLASAAVAGLLARVAVGRATLIVGGCSLACWLTAIGLYLWSLPAAVADFAEPK